MLHLGKTMNTGFSLGKLFSKGLGGGVKSPREIQPGMRYQQTRQLGSIWIVKRAVKTLGNELPHVMIVREEMEDETRVISVSALQDPHFYRYVPAKDAPNPDTSGSDS